MYPSLNPQD